MLRQYDPQRGRWKLGEIIKAYLKNAGGQVALEELLHHLRTQGYHLGSTRRVIDQYVGVDDQGRVYLKLGGSP